MYFTLAEAAGSPIHPAETAESVHSEMPTCNQEVDRFDFVQIQGGLMRYFFNITNDDL